jgi:hypothetical protein
MNQASHSQVTFERSHGAGSDRGVVRLEVLGDRLAPRGPLLLRDLRGRVRLRRRLRSLLERALRGLIERRRRWWWGRWRRCAAVLALRRSQQLGDPLVHLREL